MTTSRLYIVSTARKLSSTHRTEQDTVRLKKSRAYLSIPGAAPTCVAWGGPKRISVGYDNGVSHIRCRYMHKILILKSLGYIAVWDAQTILQSPDEDVEKALYSVAPIHETVVRCIAWHGYDDPTQFVSCGNDSHIKLTDYRDPFVNVTLQRSRSMWIFARSRKEKRWHS